MILLSLLLIIFFPILGIPLFLVGYIFDKNKNSLIYSSLLGISIALIFNFFIPPTDYDLFRHQLIVEQVTNLNFSEFLYKTNYIDLEFLPTLYSYLISFTNHINLLQFFVVALGYTIIFYIMYDYRKTSTIKTLPFIFIVLFNFFGFYTLYFISGLYFYLAVILFALAFYLDYIKKKSKLITFPIYFIILFIHNSMFFPIFILLVFKLFKNKLNIKSLLCCVLVFLLSTYILQFLSNILDNPMVTSIYNMYSNYLLKNNEMTKFYGGSILFIEITKLLVVLFALIFKQKKQDPAKDFIYLLIICLIIMIPKSFVMIRFIMLIQLIGIIPIIEFFKDSSTNKKILLCTIIAFLTLIYVYVFYNVFRYEHFENISKYLFTNIFDTLGR